MSRLLKVFAIPAVCIALTACAPSSQSAKPTPTATPHMVTTVEAVDGRMRPVRVLSGFIAPRQNVTLSTNLNEPAAKVSVVDGDRVKAGQTLAVFDVSDLQANLRALEQAANQADANTLRQQYQSTQIIGQGVGSADQARASLRQAQEKLQIDERNLQRYEQLQSAGYIAAQTTDQQRTAVATDRAAVRSAQAVLESARITVNTNGSESGGLQGATLAAQRAAAASARAQADQIRAQISRAVITAPVDGLIVNRNINPGEYPANRTLFTIAQGGVVNAVLNASAEQITGIRNGQAASITLHGAGQRPRPARVVAVLGQITPGSTNFTIKATLAHPDQDLLNGLPLSATVTLDEVRGALIPRTAFSDGTESQVVTVRDGVARRVGVRVIAESASEAIVSGIAPATRLVGDGDPGITDGDRVDASK